MTNIAQNNSWPTVAYDGDLPWEHSEKGVAQIRPAFTSPFSSRGKQSIRRVLIASYKIGAAMLLCRLLSGIKSTCSVVKRTFLDDLRAISPLLLAIIFLANGLLIAATLSQWYQLKKSAKNLKKINSLEALELNQRSQALKKQEISRYLISCCCALVIIFCLIPTTNAIIRITTLILMTLLRLVEWLLTKTLLIENRLLCTALQRCSCVNPLSTATQLEERQKPQEPPTSA